MSIDTDRKRLAQKHNLEWIRRDPKATEMVTVYRQMGSPRDYFIFCALIPPDQIEDILSDGHMSSGGPETMDGMPAAYCPSGESEIKYFRWGVNEDIYGPEPLVIHRWFSKVKESYIEISEEFRLFHNLYHDRKTDTYIKIDDAGNETTVVIVKPDEVQIRCQEIRQFLAIKEMYLSMLFEFDEYSTYSLQELELSEDEPCKFMRQDLMFCRHHYYAVSASLSSFSSYQGFRSASRLRGRRLIKPLPKSKSGFGDFAIERKQYAEFIVDVDDDGDKIYHTCDPDKLDDFLGENLEVAWKLTRVHFRKQVLDKYHNEPSKYSVEDSIVRCSSLWSMRIDNHDPKKVCVFLDDLGISLPHAEQLHWTAYNIPPEGDMSETFYRRMVLGEWASSDQPEHLFKQNYEQLQKVCNECLGWQLLKPLGSKDKYRFQRLRVPVNDEQCHFDDLVQDLQTVLIESIDVKGLKQLLPAADRGNLKGKRSIEVFEEILSFYSVEDAERRVAFLKKLQALRSEGSGHLKGKGYEKIANHFGVDSLGQREAFFEILKQALDIVEFLTTVVHSGKLTNKSGKVE